MSETARLMLSVAATDNMEIQSLDVKTAFLYGDIPEGQYIYMRRLAGLTVHSDCALHICVGSGAFLSRSKNQTVTADSSTVAEFIATH